jgi:uncharacterized protein involved in outer membrane biogenesis
VAAIIIFLLLFNWDWFRPPLARMMSARLHRPVRIVGHLRVNPWSFTPTATLGGLQIGEPAWGPKKDLADVDGITVKIKLLPIFIGQIVLPLVHIDHPQLTMFQDKDGKANWDFSDGKAPGKPTKLPAIQNFIISDGKLDITSLQRKLKLTGTINAHERANQTGGEGFRMTGQGTLNAKPFEMDVTGGPLLNVKPNVPYPFDLKVRAGETVVTAKGQVPHPFNLGDMSAQVSMNGRNLADLYYLTGIALPNTPQYAISGQLRRLEKVYTFDGFRGRVGGSDLEGNLKADMSRQDSRPYLSAQIRSRVLDFKDLGSLFGASGKNTPVKPKFAIGKAAPTPTTGKMLLPDAPLDVERVRGMDADVTYHAATVQAAPNMPLRKVSLGVKLDHGKLNLNPIDLSFPQGRLSGTAAIDASGATQTDSVDLRISNIAMQQFLPKSAGPPPIEGVLDARAQVHGIGDSVHKAAATADGRVVAVIPGGVIRQAFAELLGIDATKGLFMLLSKDQHQTDIRCAVADFRVHQGQLQVNQIVLDTGVVLLNGEGGINLKDETLNLSLKGKPKQFRLIHINAPININGRLAAPKVGVNPGGALLQGGAAGVLAAVVNPALLILPFIDPGLNKNADCAALVSEAKAIGAPVKRNQPIGGPPIKPH